MKGYMRALLYWMLNIEKVFAIMVATIVAVVLLMTSADGGLEAREMVKIYLPMMGGILCMAIMMSASSYYIPQSMSMGATRKEVFCAMITAIHVVLLQTILTAIIVNNFIMKGVFSSEYILSAALIYVLAVGAGTLMCALSLKFGNKIAMIFYVITVIIFAVCGGFMGAFFSGGDELGLSLGGTFGMINKLWFVAILFDILTMIPCYLSIRRYEVRV
ncbi:MAG: hypothetical protein J6J86_01740 [Lachnospiraceae bacterium]|nr:hypothetical protein [Lachnospiraceae bacterium]